MTKEQRATQRLIDKYIAKLTYPLGLRWWSIKPIYYTNQKEIDEIFHDDDIVDGLIVPFKVVAQWEYLQAYIYVNLPQVCNRTEKFIERAIVHELFHVLVNEMRERGIKHEERVVTTLTDAFFWLREEFEKGKK